jgi:hypothetical protein
MRPHLVGQRDERLIILLTHLLANGFQALVEREEFGIDVAIREVSGP